MTLDATETAAATSGPVVRFMDAVIRGLPAITLCAVLTITASAEFELARTVLNLPAHIAWALPVAIDSYVLAALRSGRDVLPAMGVMAGALTASMAAHLAGSDGLRDGAHAAAGQLPTLVVAPAATAIMVVLVVVAWRVHVLIGHTPTPRGVAPIRTADTVPAVTFKTGAPAGVPGPAGALSAASDFEAGAPPALPADAGAPEQVHPPADRVPAWSESGRGVRPRAAAAALAGTQNRVNAQASPEGLETARSDEQLVAAILTQADTDGGGDGELPSIRALKRRYGLGQARATRLHAQAAAARQAAAQRRPPPGKGASSPQSDEPSQNHDRTETEEPEESEHEGKNSVSSDERKEREDQSQSHSGESQRIPEQNPHTCITDRVGPPRAAEESAAALSEPEYRAISDAASTARKPLPGNSSEDSALRIESLSEAGESPC